MMVGTFPAWLHTLAIISLAMGAACAIVIVIDEVRRPQSMWIMNLVWPLTALFGSILWTAGYYAWGRTGAGREDGGAKPPFPVMVAKGTSHCGAGYALGDIIVEWAAFAIPSIAVWFGWHSLFAGKMFAVWVPDFILAFGFGIVFQYFTIAPMRNLGVGEGIVAAVKADIASISAWQIGMYGLMAAIQFGWYARAFGGIAEVNTPEFWFAMQLSMLAGFCTSYPVNWLLIRAGVKEEM